MAVEFFVPGQPVGKGRPRATVRAGRARLYTPARTADAFNGVIWRDDSQVVRVVSEKRYSDRPGVLVTVMEVRT